MGYRSDVAIAIYGPEGAMVPLIAAERLKPDGVFKIDGEYIRSYPFEVQRGVERIKYHMLHAEFTGVKWYEGYPDVQAWKKLLSDIADDPDATGLAYEFVRIGEDTDDVETGYAGDVEFYLNVSRAISFDLPDTIRFDLPENTTSSEDNHDRDNASSAA